MAAINLIPKLTAAGVGAVDELLEELDERAGRTAGLKMWANYYRAGGVFLSFLGEIWGRGTLGNLSRDASGPLITLLVKSIGKPVRTALKEHVGVATARGPYRLPPRLIGSSWPSSITKPEFADVRLT